MPSTAAHSARTVFVGCGLFAIALGWLIGALVPALFGVATDFAGPQHDGYFQIARSLARGDGFRFESDGPLVMHRPPLYPLLLVPVTWLPETAQKMAVIAINGAMVGLSCALLYLMALRLFQRPRAGYIAIALYLISPWLWRLVTLPHTALLQSTLYLASTYLLLLMCFGDPRAHGRPERRFRQLALGFGFFSGLLSLTHGVGFAIFAASLIALAAIALFHHPQRVSTPSRLGSLLLAGLVGAAIIAPWTLRNLNSFPITIPVTTGASFNYFMGDLYWGLGGHPIDDALSQRDNALIAGGVDKPAAEAMQYWGVMDPADEAVLAANMKAHAIAHPSTVLHKSLLSLAENFFPAVHLAMCQRAAMVSCEAETWYTSAHRIGLSVYYGVIILLALAALWLRRVPLAVGLFLFALGGLHIAPFLPLGQWAPHGIYALSAIVLMLPLAGASLAGRTGGHWHRAEAIPGTLTAPARRPRSAARSDAETA